MLADDANSVTLVCKSIITLLQLLQLLHFHLSSLLYFAIIDSFNFIAILNFSH